MGARSTWLGAVLASGVLLACSSDQENQANETDGSMSVGGDRSSQAPSTGGNGSGAGGGGGVATEDGGAHGTGGTPSSGGSTQGNATAIVLGEQRSGEGTYYDFADGSGACMFDKSPEAMDVAALNQPDWAGSAWCGACADVTGPSGHVRIRIVDECPECHSGDLDFSPQAFEKIALMSAGRVPISWSFVACDVSGPIRYRYKDGANIWWTAVQVLNSRLPIAKLEFSKDGGAKFESMARQDYNYFLTESGFGAGSVRVRITAEDGQELEDELPPVQELLTTDGHAQFR